MVPAVAQDGIVFEINSFADPVSVPVAVPVIAVPLKLLKPEQFDAELPQKELNPVYVVVEVELSVLAEVICKRLSAFVVPIRVV